MVLGSLNGHAGDVEWTVRSCWHIRWSLLQHTFKHGAVFLSDLFSNMRLVADLTVSFGPYMCMRRDCYVGRHNRLVLIDLHEFLSELA